MSRFIPPAWTPPPAFPAFPSQTTQSDGSIDLNWLLKLRSGVNLIIVAVAIVVVGASIAAGIAVWSWKSAAISLVLIIAFAIAFFVEIVGVWKLTTRDPGGGGEQAYGRSRKLFRLTALAPLAVFAAVPLALLEQQAAVFAIEALVAVAMIAGCVGIFAQLRYLHKLMLRLRETHLAARFEFLLKYLGTSTTAGAMLLLLAHYLSLSPQTAEFALLPSGLASFAQLAAGIFGIMFLLALEKMGRRLRDRAAALRSVSEK